jgi:hypothetical protein
MTEWILVGAPRRGPVGLEISASPYGDVFVWDCRFFAAMFGRRTAHHWQIGDIDLRGCTARWINDHGESAGDDALEGAWLLSSTGVRISLAEAVQLLGVESPESFVAGPAASARVSNSNGIPENGFYSSRKGAAHLPGKSRRWMLDHAREIPGARKVGRDWIVPCTAYNRWLAEEDAARCRATTPIHTVDGHARAIAERTLANAGLRPTREF